MYDDLHEHLPPAEAKRLSELADKIEAAVDDHLDETFGLDRACSGFHLAMTAAFQRLVARSFQTLAIKAIKTMKEKRKN